MATGKVITDNGLKELTKLHGNTGSPVAFGVIALGIGTTTPANTDTALQSEIGSAGSLRKTATITIDPDSTGDSAYTTIMYSAIWDPGEIVVEGGAPITITEIGLFNTNSVLYYHEVRGALTFDETTGVIVRIKCKFARTS